MDGDEDVLIDSGGDQESAELAIVRRQIGTTAAKRKPERAASNDHG